jgi:hypothetical protein
MAAEQQRSGRAPKPTIGLLLPTLVTKQATAHAEKCATALDRDLSKEAKKLIIKLLLAEAELLPTAKKRRR